MSETLILFDIDGTLLDTGGAGLAALREAFADEFPDEAGRMPQLDLAGATDSGLVRNIFRHAEIDHSDHNRDRYLAAYLARLGENLPRFGGRLLPGVGTLLETLAAEPDVHIGLLTGNIAQGARLKVDHFGIGHHFPFGSFGDDHHDRDQLGPIAIARARDTTGRSFSHGRTYVLGDTPKDIRCARAASVQAVAVATGSIPRDELEQHRPDTLLDDLSDTPAVLRSLGLAS